MPVDLLPVAVVFQRAPGPGRAVSGCRLFAPGSCVLIPGPCLLIPGSTRNPPEVLIEIPHRQDPPPPGCAQRIRQGLQAGAGPGAPRSVVPDLRGVVVHQDGEAVEFGEQDVARGHHAPSAIRDVFGGAAAQGEGAAATEQGAVDAAVVGGFVMDDAVVEFAQGRLCVQLPQHETVLHLREAHGVGEPAVTVGNAQQGLRDPVALGVETTRRPVLRLVLRMVIEEVFYVPEDDQQRILLIVF